MTQEKFARELETLTGFVMQYCKKKHDRQTASTLSVRYEGIPYTADIEVCGECSELLSYSVHKLQKCPHEIKPRCRKCVSPCYDKKEWKQLSKVMRYNGIASAVQKIIKVS